MSVEYRAIYTGQNELKHYGILGQKWGIRRFQNTDGTLTEEGRARYGKGNGSKKFIKDAVKDLNSSKWNSKEYKEKIKAWGKTAEESRVLDPNDPLSVYKPKFSGGETGILSDIYDAMPSVKARRDEKYNKLAKEWRRDADNLKDEQIRLLDEEIETLHPDLHKELGTKPGKETRNYLMDATRAWNECDPDEIVFQQMDDIPMAYINDYVDTKTFSKLYDANLAEAARDWVGYGASSEELKKWHNSYERNLSGESQESRLNRMFGKSDEVKHYDKDLNFVYYAYE